MVKPDKLCQHVQKGKVYELFLKKDDKNIVIELISYKQGHINKRKGKVQQHLMRLRGFLKEQSRDIAD